jgi:hypothetical protein
MGPPVADGIKVLHGPKEIAGQVSLSVQGLREIGCVAHAAFPRHPFSYALQADIPVASSTRWTYAADRLLKAARFAGRYDVFHYHTATSFVSSKLGFPDARFNRWLGKRAVVEFWGSDGRLPSVESERNPFFDGVVSRSEALTRKQIETWAEITDGHAIVSDHSLDAHIGTYFPSIHIVGQRIDIQKYTPIYPDPEKKRPLVVHIPSHLQIKGTWYVRRAVERLKDRGRQFDYTELHGVSHDEAIEACSKADLVVDQLRLGSHGVFAVEAMSLGKPVVCYILPELLSTYPDNFPIINANPDSIEAVMDEWLHRPEERHHRGVQSRAYAARVHDIRAVASRLVRAYDQLPAHG